MNGNETKNQPGQGPAASPVASWAQLVWNKDLPDLEDFLLRVTLRCRSIAAEARVAICVPAAGASFLTTHHGHLAGLACRLGENNSRVLWDAWPPEWDVTDLLAGASSGSGHGPWPSYWNRPPGPAENWSWFERVLTSDETVILRVLVLLPAGNLSDPEMDAGLDRLQDELKVILRMWIGARRAQSLMNRLQTENQALARLSTLQEKAMALASHEFKTPLTSITAYTDALRDQVTNAEFPHASEFLEVIRTEAGRLLRLVNRVSDQSRMVAGLDLMETTLVDVADLVDETILALGPMVADKGLTLRTAFQPNLPSIQADADLIRQVLVNLVGNAVKYTPAGGQIEIALEEREATVRIEVRDTGVGIADEELQRIFREYYRDRQSAGDQEGTGLGLAIVRSIVNLHAGFVTAGRRPEGGTTFAVHLPKEVQEDNPLPLPFTSRVDRDQAWLLVSQICRLAAELTGSSAAEIKLLGPGEKPVTVASMGLAPQQSREGHWLAADLGKGSDCFGSIKVGRANQDQSYTPALQDQLRVIAQTSALALTSLVEGTGGEAGASAKVLVAKVSEAIQAIMQIKRCGVPTSSAGALALTTQLGRTMEMTGEDVDRLRYAALVHDAGMARVEVEIVMGTSTLSWDQRDEVERHVEQGVELMAPLLPDPETRAIIRHHHERVDGTGYPTGLKGEEIPLGARLLAVIDAWFALTRERTFRPGLPPQEALKEIQRHSGTQFDGEVVQVLSKVLKSEGIIPGSCAPIKR